MIKNEKSPQVPDSLLEAARTNQGKYDGEDVVQALIRDFGGLCYLCGAPTEKDWHVEHLRPHKRGKYPDRKYDWKNLFLSCPNCNGIKGDRYDGTIIDCCKEDPEKLICQRIDLAQITIDPQPGQEHNRTAQDTAELLRKCFHGNSSAPQTAKCAARRKELKFQTIDLCDLLYEYREKRGTDEAEELYERIVDILMPCNEGGETKYGYTAFMRTFVRERLNMFPEFESILTNA